MKKIYFLLLLPFAGLAQQDNIWYFGYNAGLDFSAGAPVALTNGQMTTLEGCASISDSNGHLLFYTNGMEVWNKNHVIMENGQGLMGHRSSSQSAVIVPKPGSDTVYYIFTVTASAEPDGFRYSVVDMAGDNGSGAVTQKNILLHTPSCEKICATWHANGEDVWVVGHQYGNNILLAYRVTSNGVILSPVASAVGSVALNDGLGCMKFSPGGLKLAVANGYPGTQVFDFDPYTGLASNPVLLPIIGYGVEFSPSGNILYVNDFLKINQYDLLAPDIAASSIEVYVTIDRHTTIGTMQNGPDGKIYIAQYMKDKLSVINNPNVIGTGCNAVADYVDLGGKSSRLGLPNFTIATSFRVGFTIGASCQGEEVSFAVTSVPGQPETVLWDFGDGSFSSDTAPAHAFVAAGTYTIKLTAQRQGVTRIIEKSLKIISLPQISQPQDMLLCDETGEGTAVFNPEHQNAALLSTQNATDFTITYHTGLADAEAGVNSLPANFTNTSNPQTIYARMEANTPSGCYATASFDLVVTPKPVIDMPDSYVLCEGGTVLLIAPEGFDSYAWSTGESTRVIEARKTGDYILTVTKSYGNTLCGNSKTITVYRSGKPVITRVNSSDWTQGQNTISIIASGNGNYDYSIDGINWQDSPYFSNLESGIYTVYARDKNGCGIDRKEVILFMYPKFFTPNGDGYHENWTINYSWFEPGITVHIFDRYGKLLTSFKGNSTGWDGRYNGHDLPASDYWFVVERQDGREYKGHFSMIR